MLETMKQLQAVGFFGAMDVQVASLAERMVPSAPAEAVLAAALASRAISIDHACANLENYAGRSWQEVLTRDLLRMRDSGDRHPESIPNDDAISGSLPSRIEDWLQSLPPALFGDGSETGKNRTLFVQQEGRVYVRRYWDYERKVENKLIQLKEQITGETVTDEALCDYFDDDQTIQKKAVRQAVENRLSLLSGGPGTGKTYTLARAVALLATLYHERGQTLTVCMVAPTGKAAVRMKESIKKAKTELMEDLVKKGKPADYVTLIPEEATTIHSLLGARYHSPYFKHDKTNHVQADMVIVDEASMVDLPLMAKLLDALPEQCSLMLVGDIDQLASVEPGRVYGDLCHAADDEGPLSGVLTRLTTSRRFPDDSAIGNISRLTNAGDADDAWDALKDNETSSYLELHDASKLKDECPSFVNLVKQHMKAFADAKTASDALQAAGELRILCALRRGPYGVNTMNRNIEKILSTMGIKTGMGFYAHKLIIVTTNTPAQGLYNGDIGVVWAKPNVKGRFEVWFPDPVKGIRSIPAELLPEHETAFAMTVHKSQGSEFSHVALVLPDDATSPVLTRELLYTGMTRVAIDAEKKTGCLHIWCTESSFKAAVNKRTARSSGLFKK